VKQIRKRITYANVMSSIAVFLVLGGGAAYAAKKIGSNEIKGNSITTGKIKKEAVTASKIKNNSVVTAKIANGAVTGAKLNLGTVGTVPNANHAVTAENANNANAVNGQSMASYFKQVASSGPAVTALEFGGVRLTASCPAGVPNLEAINIAGQSAAIRFSSVTETNEAFANGQSSFSTLTLTNAKSLGSGTAEVVFVNGKVTTVTFAYRNDAFSGGGCRFFGHAITG
jgi:hypothetical protein